MNGQPTLVKTSTLAGLATATCLMMLPTLAFAGGSAPPGAATAAAVAATCAGPASDLDLNGDGYDDAVVGDPYATVDGRSGAGAIVVLYGDGDCRIGEGARRVITQSTAGVPGTSEAGDHFGWSVSIDDLTDDGRADILVGTPGEDVGSSADAGSVSVISFAAGSSTSAARAVSLDQGDLRGQAEAGDQFGYTVAGGDSEGDESGSVAAAGAPGEDLAGVRDAGVVDAFGFAGGQWSLAAEFQQGRSGTSPFTVALPGTPQAGDRLGAALLVAQLIAPSTGDVPAGPQWTYVMGAPGDVVAGKDDAGSVSLSYTETGFREQLTQDSPNVPGGAEAGDEFGSSLAVHETRGPGSPESSNFWRHVAVGSPGEDVGSVVDAGSVTMFRSREQGLEPGAAFHQDSPGFGGTAEAGDRFGQSVAMRSLLGSTDSVLLVGVPDEDIGSVADAGLVQTVDVRTNGFEPLRTYSESSAGTPGTVARGNHFGITVAAMQGRGEALWTISSPYQGAGSVFVSSQSGQTRSWVPGRGGIPKGAAGSRFGWSVAGLESGGRAG